MSVFTIENGVCAMCGQAKAIVRGSNLDDALKAQKTIPKVNWGSIQEYELQ